MTAEPPAPPKAEGFRCPLCASKTEVTATRHREGGRRINRRRRCSNKHCRVTFHSVEVLAARWAELSEPRTPSMFAAFEGH